MQHSRHAGIAQHAGTLPERKLVGMIMAGRRLAVQAVTLVARGGRWGRLTRSAASPEGEVHHTAKKEWQAVGAAPGALKQRLGSPVTARWGQLGFGRLPRVRAAAFRMRHLCPVCGAGAQGTPLKLPQPAVAVKAAGQDGVALARQARHAVAVRLKRVQHLQPRGHRGEQRCWVQWSSTACMELGSCTPSNECSTWGYRRQQRK